MQFTKRLRAGVRSGEITSSVRIWQAPRVQAGKRYSSMGVGQIEVDSIRQIELSDVTAKIARESGFAGVVDLLKIAKHGRGTNVYLVRFQMRDTLRQLAPSHFHVPKYLGNKGWSGLWLDLPKLDWSIVAMALRDAYARTAPKKLLAQHQ